MDIKIGDIIRIRGREQRVTRRSAKYVTLSHSGTMPIGYVEQYGVMEKSIKLPQLNVGDFVYVHDISEDEKHHYCLNWGYEKDKYIENMWPVTYIRNTGYICGGGEIVTLGDGQGFHSYHLEKVEGFDII